MFGTFALHPMNTSSKKATSSVLPSHNLIYVRQMNSIVSFPPKSFYSSRSLRLIILLFFVSILLYFFASLTLVRTNSDVRAFLLSANSLSPPLSLHQIMFGIASTQNHWMKHKEFIKIWWKAEKMRSCMFVDSLPENNLSNSSDNSSLPEIHISEDTSQFRYTHKHGYRSFIRVARIVYETVNLNHSDVKWYAFGDGDTVFFAENLVKTLSNYDHELWYYVGTSSEIYEQNQGNAFEMGFWAAGFAVSAPLAKVLAKVFDYCLERYPHLYGSDARVYSCLAELGVGLTREPGFHQVDVQGNIFGLLAAHPLMPLVSLTHLGKADPIFPNMAPIAALQHLFEAVSLDSERMLQQTVCYDRWFSWTISVSWGYAVQVFDHHVLLPDALRVQDTFSPWRKGEASNYMLTMSPANPDPCRRPVVFFLDEARAKGTTITTSYGRMLLDNCSYDPMISPKKLEEVVVFSSKSNLGIKQLQAPRRQCCDVLHSSKGAKLELSIRECKDDELIHIHP